MGILTPTRTVLTLAVRFVLMFAATTTLASLVAIPLYHLTLLWAWESFANALALISIPFTVGMLQIRMWKWVMQ